MYSRQYIQDKLEDQFGLWMTRKQIESELLKMREGKFPVEKLTIFDITPTKRNPRYTTASVAAYMHACQTPASLYFSRYNKSGLTRQ